MEAVLGPQSHGREVASLTRNLEQIVAASLVGRDGFVRYWDPDAQAPYLWNADRRIFISYDDPESMRLKARYILDHHLAGAMFWQYSDDPSGALLQALFSGLHETASNVR